MLSAVMGIGWGTCFEIFKHVAKGYACVGGFGIRAVMTSLRCILVRVVCVIGGPDRWNSRNPSSPCIMMCFMSLWCEGEVVLDASKVEVRVGQCTV